MLYSYICPRTIEGSIIRDSFWDVMFPRATSISRRDVVIGILIDDRCVEVDPIPISGGKRTRTPNYVKQINDFRRTAAVVRKVPQLVDIPVNARSRARIIRVANCCEGII